MSRCVICPSSAFCMTCRPRSLWTLPSRIRLVTAWAKISVIQSTPKTEVLVGGGLGRQSIADSDRGTPHRPSTGGSSAGVRTRTGGQGRRRCRLASYSGSQDCFRGGLCVSGEGSARPSPELRGAWRNSNRTPLSKAVRRNSRRPCFRWIGTYKWLSRTDFLLDVNGGGKVGRVGGRLLRIGD